MDKSLFSLIEKLHKIIPENDYENNIYDLYIFLRDMHSRLGQLILKCTGVKYDKISSLIDNKNFKNELDLTLLNTYGSSNNNINNTYK
ncbi:ORF MSV058 hypothetical protein [Melanoplus sanguinipes entomopoxvirus]|uniref:Uncharacterized protein n=1 Tax=Melanoplus sanguinipes entomopoxvirus TaxID=83191 RepID=Q9YW34_MSEPV|nr:ORF MSV058 hypothetical protein [Melanoplus sanguinipes entomopoxvirus]AAC97820.1 ORF MSV058 hypothetical protein [Melanoplus sanguinipes entomopoxvirus 'O']